MIQRKDNDDICASSANSKSVNEPFNCKFAVKVTFACYFDVRLNIDICVRKIQCSSSIIHNMMSLMNSWLIPTGFSVDQNNKRLKKKAHTRASGHVTARTR